MSGVDFRALSEAKLANMVDDARKGHPVTPVALKVFIGSVHQIVAEKPMGAPCAWPELSSIPKRILRCV